MSQFIVGTDLPAGDLAIARNRVRELCEALFSDRLDLSDRIYAARADARFRAWHGALMVVALASLLAGAAATAGASRVRE